jgi:hypothetical protein
VVLLRGACVVLKALLETLEQHPAHGRNTAHAVGGTKAAEAEGKTRKALGMILASICPGDGNRLGGLWTRWRDQTGSEKVDWATGQVAEQV